MARVNQIALLILFASALFVSAAGIAYPKRTHTAAEAKNKDNPGTPVPALDDQRNPHTTADHHESETYNYYGNFNYIPPEGAAPDVGFWTKHSAAVSGISTMFVAIFTGALVWTSIKQWSAIKRQGRIARSALTANRYGLNAARKAAEAATTSAKVAAQALQASRRAVLNIDPIMASIDYQTRRSTIYFEVHNSGPTKARIQEQNFHAWHHPVGQIWPVQQPFCRDGNIDPLPEVLESQQTMDSKKEIAEPKMMVPGGKSAWELFSVGGVLLCFSGYVRYLDETGDTQETRICEAWNIATKRFNSLPDMPRSYNRRS